MHVRKLIVLQAFIFFCPENTSYLIFNLLLRDCVVHNMNSEINIVSS
jgi:hypothetical protein